LYGSAGWLPVFALLNSDMAVSIVYESVFLNLGVFEV
jgi:hypothetical protein